MIFLSILREDSDLAGEIFNHWKADLPPELAPHRLIARALLHDLLTDGLKLPRQSYHLTSDASGRPLLESEAPVPGLSISHSGGWVGCAARLPEQQAGGIGLDLETAKAGRDHLELANAAFGPAEIAAVRDGGPDAFYRLWTLREAWAKARGLGFGGVTDRHDHVPPQLFTHQTAADAAGYWWSAKLNADLHFALMSLRAQAASESAAPIISIHRMSPDLTLDGLSFQKIG